MFIMELKPFQPLQLVKRHIKTPTSLGLLEQAFSRDGRNSDRSHFMVTLLSSVRAACGNVTFHFDWRQYAHLYACIM